MPVIQRINAAVAARLEEVANLLAAQEANPYRVNAYCRAATTVRQQERPLNEIVAQQGIAGLDTLPGIGKRLAERLYDDLGLHSLELGTTRRALASGSTRRCRHD